MKTRITIIVYCQNEPHYYAKEFPFLIPIPVSVEPLDSGESFEVCFTSFRAVKECFAIGCKHESMCAEEFADFDKNMKFAGWTEK